MHRPVRLSPALAPKPRIPTSLWILVAGVLIVTPLALIVWGVIHR